MKKQTLIGWMAHAVILGMALATLSCGGGGGGGGGDSALFPGFTPVSTNTVMSVDDDSAAKAAGMASFAHVVGTIAGGVGYAPLHQQDNRQADQGPEALFRAVLGLVGSHLGDAGYQPAGAASASENCPYGGSLRGSFQWDGPNTIYSECELVNLRGTLTMHNCRVDSNSAMDGTIRVRFTGDGCQPTAMAITLEDFTYTTAGSQILTRYLNLRASDLAWQGEMPYGGYVLEGTSVLNGQAIGVGGSEEHAAAFSDYTEIVSTFLGEDYAYYTRLDIFGAITGPCLDGWAYIETDPEIPIILSDASVCPVDGYMVIYGDYAMDVTYYSDGSLMVGERLYASCEDVDATCPLP